MFPEIGLEKDAAIEFALELFYDTPRQDALAANIARGRNKNSQRFHVCSI